MFLKKFLRVLADFVPTQIMDVYRQGVMGWNVSLLSFTACNLCRGVGKHRSRLNYGTATFAKLT